MIYNSVCVYIYIYTHYICLCVCARACACVCVVCVCLCVCVCIQYIQLLTRAVRRELLHVESFFPKTDMNIVFWFKSLNACYFNDQNRTRLD